MLELCKSASEPLDAIEAPGGNGAERTEISWPEKICFIKSRESMKKLPKAFLQQQGPFKRSWPKAFQYRTYSWYLKAKRGFLFSFCIFLSQRVASCQGELLY